MTYRINIKVTSWRKSFFFFWDLNGHVGTYIDDFKSILDGYGFGTTNEGGKTILDFCLAYTFLIANTLFKKRDKHLITYKNGYSKIQIDYFLIKKLDHLDCKDCKVIPNKNLCTKHRLLILNFKIKGQKIKNKVKQFYRIR